MDVMKEITECTTVETGVFHSIKNKLQLSYRNIMKEITECSTVNTDEFNRIKDKLELSYLNACVNPERFAR